MKMLQMAGKLGPTTQEMGLAPHLEWPCKDEVEMKKRMGALFAARRRNTKDYGRVGLMQRAMTHKNEYIIFLWNSLS
jgi:hypothetical protein